MIVTTLTLSLPLIYDAVKTMLSVGGVIVSVYKGVQWVKDIREKDLKDLKEGIIAMQDGLEKQTTAIVSELQEQQQDFHTFYAPLLSLATQTAMAPARAKRSPRPKARKAARKAPKKK